MLNNHPMRNHHLRIKTTKKNVKRMKTTIQQHTLVLLMVDVIQQLLKMTIVLLLQQDLKHHNKEMQALVVIR